MQKSTFYIAQMGSATEEHTVRMKLDGQQSVKRMAFDLAARQVDVWHTGEIRPISSALSTLGLGARLLQTEYSEKAAPHTKTETSNQERKLLQIVLLINAAFFFIEMVAGWWANSMALVADSLDMLADALVYSLSLWAVGSTLTRQKNIAKLSGYFQLGLAVLGLAEVVRRFMGAEALPDFWTMVGVSAFALVGNSVSLYLLQKSRQQIPLKASLIFTSTDVMANLGVMVAGVLVYVTQSAVPDLVIGVLVFLLVARGAFRILSLAKS
ncbi:cation transporter [Rufibacter glacialis]|uniref:Cation transporter n=1 Tax=Rufibacter glacialis TaxID=1259555 RepID=A0A5M8QF19_9BACT|nr:cation transporter [Rufibacter glacialis]KAA6433356.1 cation transporter [Rufibacter glacialis]GGK75009.1 transporter [Rufibacter glacialis]